MLYGYFAGLTLGARWRWNTETSIKMAAGGNIGWQLSSISQKMPWNGLKHPNYNYHRDFISEVEVQATIYKRGDGSNNCCPFLSGWLMRISSSTIRGLESDVEQEKPQYSVQKKDPESLSSNIHYLQVLRGLSRWPWKPELAIPGGLVIPWSSPLVPHFQTRIQRSQEWAAVDRKATSDVAVANILLPITYGVALYRSRFMAPLGVVKKLVVYNFEFWSFQFPGSFHGSFYHFSMKPVFFLQKTNDFSSFLAIMGHDHGIRGPWRLTPYCWCCRWGWPAPYPSCCSDLTCPPQVVIPVIPVKNPHDKPM